MLTSNSAASIYRTAFKNMTAYRASMLISLLTGPAYLLVYYVIWKSVFAASGKAVISGFSFQQLITYYVVAFITLYLIWDDVIEHIKRDIMHGDMAVYLLKPVSYGTYHFFVKLGHRTLAFFIEFIPVVIILGLLFGFETYATQNLLFFFAAVGVAFVISYLVHLLIGLLSFWFIKPDGLIWIFRVLQGLLSGALLPLSFFPEAVQKIFFFLPFQFMNYVPASVFMGNYELAGLTMHPLQALLYGLVQVVVLLVVVGLGWRLALRKFCGVGT